MCLGIPGRIVSVDDAADMIATVDVCGVRRQINVSCVVDDAHPIETIVGDWVLIHVGFAMSRIDEAQAAETLRILAELGETQAELESMQHSQAAHDRDATMTTRPPAGLAQ
ncbi:MAG: HypC/HybG/HupF family hydrogenase formation chaperone [Hyphomicrobiales bacterium]|nr:HypC/HybG/HupF family hydrogenase formation chaperone [Hyphomicrobiales bacterium]